MLSCLVVMLLEVYPAFRENLKGKYHVTSSHDSDYVNLHQGESLG